MTKEGGKEGKEVSYYCLRTKGKQVLRYANIIHQNDAGHATCTHRAPKRNPNRYICLPFTVEAESG